MNGPSPQWLKHYYQHETDEELQLKLAFSMNAAERHMLELEINRRKEDKDEGNPRAV